MQLTRFLPAFAALLGALPAPSQSVLETYLGSQTSQQLGVVAGGHDLDGDGVSDLVLGSPKRGAGFSVQAGYVEAISAASGAVIWSQTGASGSELGTAIDLIPDLSGDGIADVLVGAPGGFFSTSPGELFVYSGSTGALVLSRSGIQSGEGLGTAVAGDFDWDHDGIADFAAGAPFYDGALGQEGRLFVWSGFTGAWLDTRYGADLGNNLGAALAGGGDFEGDGFNDLAVGEPNFGAGGRVQFLPGTACIEPIFTNAMYGAALVCVGDLSGDGKDDWLVGAPGRNSGAGTGLIYGANIGATASNGSGSDALGSSVAALGDVDGDGFNDLALGATQGVGPGYIRVVSGRFQTQLFELAGQSAKLGFGLHLAGVGDHNADGVPDLAVGAPGFDGGSIDSGRVEVYSGGGPGFVNYCTPGSSASGCTATLLGSGTPSAVLGVPFTLSANGVEGDKRGLFFYGWNGRQANPWGTGSSFNCVVPPVKRTPLQPKFGTPAACDGQFSLDLNAFWQANANKNPGAGAVVQAQFWHRDPANGSSQPTSLSDALEFVVAP